jgi:hypothetical protein
MLGTAQQYLRDFVASAPSKDEWVYDTQLQYLFVCPDASR